MKRLIDIEDIDNVEDVLEVSEFLIEVYSEQGWYEGEGIYGSVEIRNNTIITESILVIAIEPETGGYYCIYEISSDRTQL